MKPDILDEVEKIITPMISVSSPSKYCPLKNKIALCFLRLKNDFLNNEHDPELEGIIQKHENSLNNNLSDSDKTREEIREANQAFEDIKAILWNNRLISIPINWTKSTKNTPDQSRKSSSSGGIASSVLNTLSSMMWGMTPSHSNSTGLSEKLLPASSKSSNTNHL
jgi:hypothetical protein